MAEATFTLDEKNLAAFEEFMGYQNKLPIPETGFHEGENFTLHAECT